MKQYLVSSIDDFRHYDSLYAYIKTRTGAKTVTLNFIGLYLSPRHSFITMDSVKFVITAGAVISVATVVSGAALPVPEPVPQLIEARLNVRRVLVTFVSS